jgi:hypothetical protein
MSWLPCSGVKRKWSRSLPNVKYSRPFLTFLMRSPPLRSFPSRGKRGTDVIVCQEAIFKPEHLGQIDVPQRPFARRLLRRLSGIGNALQIGARSPRESSAGLSPFKERAHWRFLAPTQVKPQRVACLWPAPGARAAGRWSFSVPTERWSGQRPDRAGRVVVEQIRRWSDRRDGCPGPDGRCTA